MTTYNGRSLLQIALGLSAGSVWPLVQPPIEHRRTSRSARLRTGNNHPHQGKREIERRFIQMHVGLVSKPRRIWVVDNSAEIQAQKDRLSFGDYYIGRPEWLLSPWSHAHPKRKPLLRAYKGRRVPRLEVCVQGLKVWKP